MASCQETIILEVRNARIFLHFQLKSSILCKLDGNACIFLHFHVSIVKEGSITGNMASCQGKIFNELGEALQSANQHLVFQGMKEALQLILPRKEALKLHGILPRKREIIQISMKESCVNSDTDNSECDNLC